MIRMSTSLRALCCQSGLVATLVTPIKARSRSIGSRSSRISPLLIARFTRARIASQIREYEDSKTFFGSPNSALSAGAMSFFVAM